MDIYQVTAQCPGCGGEVRVVLEKGNQSYGCDSCSRPVFKSTKLAGVVYVLSHPHVSGVKIGMTEKDVYKRAKAISGTGVPGDFEVIAYFPSHRPKADEKKVHAKLRGLGLGKEHFDLPEALAVAKVRSTLGKEPLYVHRDVRGAYEALLEERREKAARRFAKKAGPVTREAGPSQVDMSFD